MASTVPSSATASNAGVASPPAIVANYVTPNIWKELITAAPTRGAAVTPFARVTISYVLSIAVSTASYAEDLFSDHNSSTSQQQRNRQPQMRELHTFREGTTPVETVNAVEIHLTSGHPHSPLVAGIDIGISTMRVGEEALFIMDASKAFLESGTMNSNRVHSDATIAVRVNVLSSLPEIDFTEGRRLLVKHVMREGAFDMVNSPYPQYDATVKFTLSELDPLTGQWGKKLIETKIGGDQTTEWVDRVLQSMKPSELCVAQHQNQTCRILLQNFDNGETPLDNTALENVKRMRTDGNKMFAAKNSKAYYKYSVALHFCSPQFYPSIGSTVYAELQELQAALHGNCALVASRNKEHELCVQHCTHAIQFQSHQHKFFFRRAKAQRMLKRFELAKTDLECATHLLKQSSAPNSPTGSQPVVSRDMAEIEAEIVELERDMEMASMPQ